jgi:D-amino-acid dehydrogenase
MRVAVIGSGLMGLLTAYYLQQSGAEVLVIDRQDSSARETSFANGAMLHASQASPWNSPGILSTVLRSIGREDSAVLLRANAIPKMLGWGVSFLRNSKHERFLANLECNARLAQYSIQEMARLRAAEQLEYDFRARGTMTIYSSAEDLERASQFFDSFSNTSVDFELLDRERTVALESALNPISERIAGSIYYPQDESGDAFKFCLALQGICQRNGVEFSFDTRVTKLSRKGSSIEAVESGSKRFLADKYVLAAGSFTPLLSRTVGLHIPVQPVKGYSITAPVGTWRNPPSMPVIDDHFHAAVCPIGDRLRVAGTAEFAGYNHALTKSRIENLFKLLRSMYPEYERHENLAATDRWTGLRPMTPRGVGIMGKTPIKNLFVNTGHGHLGWTMAAGAGRAVADEVLGIEPTFDLSDYHLDNI